jgi:hypothetical protein
VDDVGRRHVTAWTLLLAGGYVTGVSSLIGARTGALPVHPWLICCAAAAGIWATSALYDVAVADQLLGVAEAAAAAVWALAARELWRRRRPKYRRARTSSRVVDVGWRLAVVPGVRPVKEAGL